MNVECPEDILQEAISVCKRLVNSPKFSNCLKVKDNSFFTNRDIVTVYSNHENFVVGMRQGVTAKDMHIRLLLLRR